MAHDLSAVCTGFPDAGKFVSGIPYGTGHINDTYKVETDKHTLIVQRVNTSIFRQPEELMDNFVRVTSHIARKLKGGNSADKTLSPLFNAQGKPWFRDAEGNFWRSYIYVDKARTYDIIENDTQAFEAAAAFGRFQNYLADMPGRLFETIPNFHHTVSRLNDLKAAVAADKVGRLKEVGREVDFVMAREKDCGLLLDLQAKGEIVERTTHNDTKLNNVLISEETGKGICVIDLDTVMPGLPHYDFGDMVRTGTSPAAEDEKDLTKVRMRFEMFEALLRGYLSAAGQFLNPLEKSLLPFSGKLITLEIGIRFLTDYLSGDVYFKVKRPGHNLDRCRTQFKLVSSIEEQFDAMRKLTDSL